MSTQKNIRLAAWRGGRKTKKAFLSASVLWISATAGIAQQLPKVVFTGDAFTLAWQKAPQFSTNKNWVGAGVPSAEYNSTTAVVLQRFQKNVIDRHPAFVHIMTGASDIDAVHDSEPLGFFWHLYEEALEPMVARARAANIKIILGNVASNQGVDAQLFNTWLAIYGMANNLPVVNYHDALCQCVGSTSTENLSPLLTLPDPSSGDATPTDAGYALITQMAEIAIQTYGLTIKSGYLSNVLIAPSFSTGGKPLTQVNNVNEGEVIAFTPQAKWSDSVVRPMLNQDLNGLKGTWTSSNTAVLYVNQQGQAFAYNAGTATISFCSASGVPFSPWRMTVQTIYGPSQ